MNNTPSLWSLNNSIDLLEFTLRTYNALRRAGIDTLGQLIFLIQRKELRSLRNVGESAETEILQKTRAYLATLENVDVEELLNPALEELIPVDSEMNAGPPPPAIPVPAWHYHSIACLNLPPRLFHLLEKHHYLTLGKIAELCKQSAPHEIGMFGLGLKSLTDLKSVLTNYLEKLPSTEFELKDLPPLPTENPIIRHPAPQKSDLPLWEQMQNWLGSLKGREQKIIYQHYGLQSAPLTLEEIGQQLGLTRARILQLEDRALTALTHSIPHQSLYQEIMTVLTVALDKTGGILTFEEAPILITPYTPPEWNPQSLFALIAKISGVVTHNTKAELWQKKELPLSEIHQQLNLLRKKLEPGEKCYPLAELRGTYPQLTEAFLLACLRIHPKMQFDDQGPYLQNSRPIQPDFPASAPQEAPITFPDITLPDQIPTHTLLLEYEEKFQPSLKKIRLLGEIPISQEEATQIATLFKDFFQFFKSRRGNHSLEPMETIEHYYPLTFALFMVNYGIYHYNDGDYWSAISEVLQKQVDFKFKQLFKQIVQNFKLPLFEELTERSTRYVSLILAHGGIPVYCLRDYFNNIVLPGITRPQFSGLEGRELLDQILQNSSYSQLTDKPVLYFLEYGGKTAEDIFERSRKMLIDWQRHHQPPTPLETGLPPHIVDFFSPWIAQQEIQLETNRNLRNRLRRPELFLDPWGLGIFLRLPAQSISALVEADLSWKIAADEHLQTPKVRIIRKEDRLETNEIVLRITSIPQEFTITFRAGDKNYDWKIIGLTHDHPLLIFDPARGALQNQLFSKEQWIVYPETLTLNIQGDAAPLIENFPALPDGGMGLTCQSFDFSQAQHLSLLEGENLRYELTIRHQEKAPIPTLEGGSILSTDALEDPVPLYVGTAPWLSIPLPPAEDLQETLSQWQLKISPQEEALPPEGISLRLSELPAPALKVHAGIVDLDLNHPALLGRRPCGTFKIQIAGPLGNDAGLTFRIVPQFQIEGLDTPYIPDRHQGSAPVSLECFTELNDDLVMADHTDDLKIEPLRPGNFQITVPSGISAVKLLLIKALSPQRSIQIPINLRLKRLRWRWISGNEITEKWTDTLTTIPIPALQQTTAPLLLVDFPAPATNDLRLSLHLLNTAGAEEAAPLLLQLHKTKSAGRFWRFDLSRMADSICHSTSPILRAELHGTGSDQLKKFELPVLSFTQQMAVEKLEVLAYASTHRFHINVSWEEKFHLHSRVLYLWSLFRPWQTPLVHPIPDEAGNEYEFSIPREELPGSRYRLALDVVDPWINPPPPLIPPAPQTPGTAELELVPPVQRLEALLATPSFGNQLEAGLTHLSLEKACESQSSLAWCCQHLIDATGPEILTLAGILTAFPNPDLKNEYGENIIHPVVLRRLMENSSREFISDALLEILKPAPPPRKWPLETALLLSQVDIPILKLPALRRLLHLNIGQGCRRILELLKGFQLSKDDAVEILFTAKEKAMDALAELAPTDPLAPQIIKWLTLFNPLWGLPTVKTGNWIHTNAGWGRIENIVDLHSHQSIESFLEEGQNHYQLTVQLHLHESADLTGEKVLINLETREILFPHKSSLFICPYCPEFITAQREIYKTHLVLNHGNAVPHSSQRLNSVPLQFSSFSHHDKSPFAQEENDDFTQPAPSP